MFRDKAVAEDLRARDSALLRRVGLDTSSVLLSIDRRRRH
jgi:hypothetical protein